jgi:type IV pilus assembly protein PilQ
MRLEITPHVINGKNLKMTIFVQKDDVDFTQKDFLGDPYIIKKQTQTVLIVKDGETIVISGLTKHTRSDGNTGWPWLKDIPVLGWAFKSDSKDDKMEEVLIFITPHILKINDNSQNIATPIVEGTLPKKDAELNQKESEKKVN